MIVVNRSQGVGERHSGETLLWTRSRQGNGITFRYPFHPRVTAVARKRSRSFCQKGRWQVTAKHAYTLPMSLRMKWLCNLVHGCMVHTELAPRRQHFTWHQPCNNQRTLPVHHFRDQYTTSVDINTCYYRIQSLVQNHRRHVRSESAGEQRIVLYKSYE